MSHLSRVRVVAVVAVVLILLIGLFSITQAGQPAARRFDRFDPLRDSLARSEPQAIYSPDPKDAWNQAFFLLFTRTIASQVMADGAQMFAAGDARLALSGRRVTRIESGDRAIDPLYPSWLWMGSTALDFEPGRAWRILREPAYSRLVAALEGVRRTASSRPPLARALMQADLWSAHDMLHKMMSIGHPPRAPDSADRDKQAQALLPLIASTMRALALSREEIAQLPDTYTAAAATPALNLPDLFGSGSDWMEVRWKPHRTHESAASHRRVARVFVQPAVRPNDATAFLEQFRGRDIDDGGALRSVALLIQLLLVASDGTVVPSRITYEVQFRGTAARASGAEIPQYDLSRRRLLSSSATGGFVGVAADAPAYLPIAMTDFSFATLTSLDGEAVVAPLGTRCTLCHGGPGVGRLLTFAWHAIPGKPSPPVERLVSAQNVHPGDVARRKMDQADFKALQQHWR
jgi:hypothetical protein